MITEKISNSEILSGTINASSNLAMGIGSSNSLVGGNINTFTKETDPTIPDYIKEISEEDIAGWDNNAVVNEEQNKTLIDLETYIDIVTPKNTVSGELVHITDGLPLPTFENKVDGNVEQETTRGVNLIDKNNNILDSSGRVGIDISNLVIGETYTFSSSVAINLMKISNISDGYNSVQNIVYNGFKTFTFTMARDSHISEDKKQYLWIKLNPTTWVTDISQLGDLQIEPGDTATEIEKYTGGIASPNPNYEQPIKVLEGYNEFDKNNANVIDGYFHGTTSNITSNPDRKIIYIPTKPNTTYTISTPENIITSNMFVVGYTTELPTNGVEVKNINYSSGSIKTITTGEDALYLVALIYRDGYTLSYEEVLDGFQIVKGTKVKPYVPYGCVGVKVNGKNLVSNQKRVGNIFYPTNQTNQESFPFKPGTYTLSYKSDKTIITTYKIEGGSNVNLGTNKEVTFTANGNFNVWLYVSGMTDTDVTDWQIELGDKATEYEPYQEQIVYLDLKGNWVGAINDDIRDYLVTDKRKLWLVKNVAKIVLDGSEDILRRETSTTGLYRFIVRLNLPNIVRTDTIEQSQLISNRFYGITREDTWLLKQGIAYGTSDNYYGDFVIYSDTIKEMTVEEFKQWLSENNVEVYYQLAEPQIIELGELPEPIKTFEGTNNIQVLANLDTEIEVKYALDVKKYADDRYIELTNALVSTGANL